MKVAKTTSFLGLYFPVVINILSSFKLRITSVLQVMNSADARLNYDYDSKWKCKVKYFLSKVRLHLLSELSSKKVCFYTHITSNSSVFKKINIVFF